MVQFRSLRSWLTQTKCSIFWLLLTTRLALASVLGPLKCICGNTLLRPWCSSNVWWWLISCCETHINLECFILYQGPTIGVGSGCGWCVRGKAHFKGWDIPISRRCISSWWKSSISAVISQRQKQRKVNAEHFSSLHCYKLGSIYCKCHNLIHTLMWHYVSKACFELGWVHVSVHFLPLFFFLLPQVAQTLRWSHANFKFMRTIKL